jgi:hypothetical protein
MASSSDKGPFLTSNLILSQFSKEIQFKGGGGRPLRVAKEEVRIVSEY